MEIFAIPLNDARPLDPGPLSRSSRPGDPLAATSELPSARLPWPQAHFLAGPENASICTLANRFLPQLLSQRQAVEHWNPLVLHGPTGSGKSHLVHGLLARWQEQDSHTSDSSCLLNSVDFARELAAAIEVNRVAPFRARFLRCRLFILEDLQHLLKKPSTQYELQLLIDGMTQHGCQCIITSNRSVAQLPWLTPTLASRLMAGMSLNVRRISPATRLVLLRDLLAARGFQAESRDLEQIAALSGKSLANLRGAVAELELLARHAGTTDMSQLLSTWSQRQPTRVPTMDDIIRIHAEHFHLSMAELRSAARTRTVVLARSLAMLLAREMMGTSYTDIGKALGGRDHSTVLYACRKIKELVSVDSAARAAYQTLQNKITNITKDPPTPDKRTRNQPKRARRTA